MDESRLPTEGTANLRHMSPWQYLLMMRRARIVHIHSSNPLVRLVHTIVARLHGRKVVQTVHALLGSRFEPLALRLAGMLSHKGIGVNAVVAKSLGSTAAVIPAFIAPPPDEEVIPDDIMDWIKTQKHHNQKIIAINAFRSELKDGKDLYGLDMLIESFQDIRIKESFSGIICISTAQGFEQYHHEIERRVTALSTDAQLKLILGQSNFPAILRHCDLFVRPTTTDGDALSVREALWYGKPAIASDAVARPEGTIVFTSRDLKQFVETILAASTAEKAPSVRRDFAEDVILLYESVAAAS
ncbi:glycosyltransferase [Bosea sp. (in: a-proteobacteria)]|uniref:glycosyltransferase n=1 Tax=Bosea sp. (in: a-proteobacteria) TaxID=1871050 RepID=UPI00260563F8|nr:glycosyltransferase [Bosea sp. (in: a-proteobacteria)]MCO5091033.1 glycosyltransferase [Bosea sp. (in: a-proteobacteria)]